jgi:endonuclease-3 related protein
MATSRETLLAYFRKLKSFYGPQRGWWPGESRFEVMIGAVLVQHANWRNAEKALHNLKLFRLLSPEKLRELDEETLQEAIRPAGQFRQKARRLKALVGWLCDRYDGDMDRARRAPVSRLREELMELPGIGPETCDTILLFALDLPEFVVDTYTYRVLSRHHLAPEETSYEEMQALFHENLPRDPEPFKEYHALLVEVGKEFCRPEPKCDRCPLKLYLPQHR